MPNNIPSMIRRIGREQGLSGAQIRAMLATSKVESGWNPSSVGDGGTSFGLFQHHVGGAGGSTVGEARRFLNPETSIRERARWFKKYDIKGGAGAARLQRPSDPLGYQEKVDAALRGIGGWSAASPPSPRQSHSASLQSSGNPFADKDAGRQFLADYLYADDPVLGLLTTLSPSSGVGSEHNSGAASSTPSNGGFKSYKDVMRNAGRFGLMIQGESQTTGGKHAEGSLHYSGRAVDFGDATNNPNKMNQYANYLRRNAGRLGINELYYDPLGWYISNGKIVKGSIGGHGDHLHVGV